MNILLCNIGSGAWSRHPLSGKADLNHVAGYGMCQLTHLHTDKHSAEGLEKSVSGYLGAANIWLDSMDCSPRQRHTSLQRSFCGSLLNIYFYTSRPQIFLYIGCLKVIVACSINYVYVVHRNI